MSPAYHFWWPEQVENYTLAVYSLECSTQCQSSDWVILDRKKVILTKQINCSWYYALYNWQGPWCRLISPKRFNALAMSSGFVSTFFTPPNLKVFRSELLVISRRLIRDHSAFSSDLSSSRLTSAWRFFNLLE